MHARADMGSRKRADMDLESRAISARVTKQIVTIFSKACDKTTYHIFTIKYILLTYVIQATISFTYQDCIS